VQDIKQELILDSDSDAYTSEDEDISPTESDSDNKGVHRTETGCIEWTDTTQS
jgi:hypothetical protein